LNNDRDFRVSGKSALAKSNGIVQKEHSNQMAKRTTGRGRGPEAERIGGREGSEELRSLIDAAVAKPFDSPESAALPHTFWIELRLDHSKNAEVFFRS
jgi:hypothetical protein